MSTHRAVRTLAGRTRRSYPPYRPRSGGDGWRVPGLVVGSAGWGKLKSFAPKIRRGLDVTGYLLYAYVSHVQHELACVACNAGRGKTLWMLSTTADVPPERPRRPSPEALR